MIVANSYHARKLFWVLFYALKTIPAKLGENTIDFREKEYLNSRIARYHLELGHYPNTISKLERLVKHVLAFNSALRYSEDVICMKLLLGQI